MDSGYLHVVDQAGAENLTSALEQLVSVLERGGKDESPRIIHRTDVCL